MGGFMFSGAAWGMMLLGAIFWMLILVGLGFLVYGLIRRNTEAAANGSSPRDDPMALARIRYARGEITREEFQQIQEDLQDRKGGRS